MAIVKNSKVFDNLLTIFLVTLLIAFFIWLVEGQSSIMYEPPATILKTKLRMITIKTRVVAYIQQYNKIPNSLEVLPAVPGPINNIITDGWGRKIQFISKNNTIFLESYGEDNRKGGWGVNRDIKTVLKFKKINGRWVLTSIRQVHLIFPKIRGKIAESGLSNEFGKSLILIRFGVTCRIQV